MNLQERATHCPNSLLNVQMGVPVGEKPRVACNVLLEIMRSCHHLSVGSSSADINRDIFAQTGFSPSGHGALL
jgi:hypothetical protein